jgi:hypothetical protein
MRHNPQVKWSTSILEVRYQSPRENKPSWPGVLGKCNKTVSYEIKLLEVVARLGAPRVGIGSPRTCVQASPRALRKPPGSGQSAPSCSDEPAGTTRGPQAPVPSRLEMRPHPQLRPFPLLDPAPRPRSHRGAQPDRPPPPCTRCSSLRRRSWPAPGRAGRRRFPGAGLGPSLAGAATAAATWSLALAATLAAWSSCRRLWEASGRAEGDGEEGGVRGARRSPQGPSAEKAGPQRLVPVTLGDTAGPATETEAGLHGACAGPHAHAQCRRRKRSGLFPGGAAKRSAFRDLGDFRLRASGTHSRVPGSTVALQSAALLGRTSSLPSVTSYPSVRSGLMNQVLSDGDRVGRWGRAQGLPSWGQGKGTNGKSGS